MQFVLLLFCIFVLTGEFFSLFTFFADFFHFAGRISVLSLKNSICIFSNVSPQKVSYLPYIRLNYSIFLQFLSSFSLHNSILTREEKADIV